MRQLDANRYSTSMQGLKIKLAHKRAGTDEWSASEEAQRRHLIAALKQLIVQLEGDALRATPPRAATRKRAATSAS